LVSDKPIKGLSKRKIGGYSGDGVAAFFDLSPYPSPARRGE
jgi:hypothetical protein